MILVEKLLELNWYTVAILIALVLLGFALYKSAKTARWNSRTIANAAMCIAIAFVLSCIRLYKMPQGGSITPASMLPLILFALAYGPWQSALVGCAYGLLQLIQDPYVIHPVQLLVDYPLAFGAMALAALAGFLPVNRRVQLPIAVFLGFVGRYAMAVLSGTVFFAEAAGDQAPLIYSLIYNLSYLGPDALLCIALSLIPGLPMLIDTLKGDSKRLRS